MGQINNVSNTFTSKVGTYLRIVNRGQIEVEALTLMGASDKRGDDNKIGMFGSGNKYAISVLIRNNIPFVIMNGTQEIQISTQTVKFRNKEFEKIIIDGKETSITTEMGPHWKVWQAIRELYSNAIDEGLVSFGMTDEVKGEEGYTSIYILNTLALEDMLNNIKDYFAEDKYYLDRNVEDRIGIYAKHGEQTCIYRKGIRCIPTDYNRVSLFDYEVNNVSIGEDRLITNMYNVYSRVVRMLFSTKNKVIIKKVLDNANNTRIFETYALSYAAQHKESLISDEWLEVIGNRKIATELMSVFLNEEEIKTCIYVTSELYGLLIKRFGVKIMPVGIGANKDVVYGPTGELTNLQNDVLNKAINFYIDTSYQLSGGIHVVKFADRDIFGTINQEENMLLIGVNSLDKGLHFTVNTIFEEHIHLKYNVADCTRGFQTSAIDEFINYMQQVNQLSI